MPIFAVEYTYDVKRTEDLNTLRADHRSFLSGLLDEGVLLASGPWLDNAAPGALLLLRGRDGEEVTRVLDHDPYQRAKLVTHRSVRAWKAIYGPFDAE